MSLVVCSNQAQDGQESRNPSSISKPWAFRNTLSSTYTIPENAQVALTSCKVNIPERVVIGGNQNKLYHWLGKPLTLDSTTTQIADTTSYPVQIRLTEDDTDRQTYEDMNATDFAARLSSRLDATTYHPNFKGKVTATRLQNSDSTNFEGYEITYDQHNAASNATSKPADDTFDQHFLNDARYKDEASSQFFTFTNSTGVFQRVDSSVSFPTLPSEIQQLVGCAGINTTSPISNASGVFSVNVSGTGANANASGVEWHMGLARALPQSGPQFQPSYDITSHQQIDRAVLDVDNDPPTVNQSSFMDFAICRSFDGELVLYQAKRSDTGNSLMRTEVDYWNNTNSSFTGSTRLDLSHADNYKYTKARLVVDGEKVRADLYNNATSKWDLITAYDAGLAVPTHADSYFKPVTQSCWCLHPVLAVGVDQANTHKTCTLSYDRYDGLTGITDYDPTVKNGGGWYENNKIIGTDNLSQEVDTRNYDLHVRLGVNASGGVALSPNLILSESDIYANSTGANAQDLLGFSRSIIQTGDVTQGSKVIFRSDTVPSLAPQFSMFLKLNNLTQNSVNALAGNRSKILAHLTTFEQATGRLTYEPSNLLYLDLNNPSPLHMNEFDISFCYINEQFAEVLTGQSIVSLVFRKKPKELI